MLEKKKLQEQLYLKLIEILFKSHSGHVGSCLSCLDILIQTWIYEMREKDKFILSKGHAAPTLYVILNYLGKITDKDLNTFHSDGTKLPAHTPNYYYKNEIPFPTGSLGHGLSLACGIAEGYIYSGNKERNVYCLISDGECNEGQVWEAAQFASQRKLSNLNVLVDRNQIQALGFTKDVLGDSATKEKWDAFGFEVYETDGHNLDELEKNFLQMRRSRTEKPKILICSTVKGHAVSFLENTVDSHYTPLNDENYKIAVSEIKERYA